MDAQEKEVLARAVRGDREALCQILERFGPGVEESLRVDSTWRGVLDPADVMQVTYLEAFLQIHRFDIDRAESFPAWLRQMARNNLRDAIRALSAASRPPEQQRVAADLPGDSHATLFELLSAAGGTPSRAARLDEAAALLQAAIDQLPDDYATAVRLYDLEGKPIEAVAAEMGRSPGAVHMLRLRAHDRLRELLFSASRVLDTRA